MTNEPKTPAQATAKPDEAPAGSPAAAAPQTPEQLTPEEQMARFEKELKENDWGHQPC